MMITSLSVDNQVLVISTYDSNSAQDCVLETFLNDLYQFFQDYEFTHRDKQLKLIRIDIKDVKGFKQREREGLQHGNSIYVKKDMQYFEYKGSLDKATFISFLNKIINPYLHHFDKVADIERFLNPTLELVEKTELYKKGYLQILNDFQTKFRAVLFLYDRSRVPGIMRQFTEACENLANREDLRMGFVGDRVKVLTFIKNNAQYSSSIGQAKNIVLMARDDGQHYILNLDEEQQFNIERWISVNSVETVQLIENSQHAKLISMSKMPTLLLFMDTSKQSKEVLNAIRELSAQYHQQILFAFINDPKLIDMRYKLGITKSHIPWITIVTHKGVLYPFRYEVLDQTTIDNYLKDYLTGQIRPLNNERLLSTVDLEMDLRLARTKQLVLSQAFKEHVILNTDQDVVVLFFSSEQDSAQWRRSLDIVSAFDTAAQRFKEHLYTSVLLCSYDVYRYGLPDEKLIGIEVPSLLMFKAKDKSQVARYQRQHFKVAWIMEFVAENASIKITLLDKSHLPVRLAKITDQDLVTEDPRYNDM